MIVPFLLHQNGVMKFGWLDHQPLRDKAVDMPLNFAE
jgi:hypothetical protein